MENRQTVNLVVDVGNTLTKIAIFRNDEMLHFSKNSFIECSSLSKLMTDFDVERSILSSVGEFSSECEDFLAHNCSLVKFNSQTPLPIRNCYTTPETLGPDRLAAAVGANALYPRSNVLAIDSGTALTYEIVTMHGDYIGGSISPGISMRFKALNMFTSRLPLIAFEQKELLYGTNTHDAILTGVLNGIVNEVDGYIDSVRKQYSPLEVVFTGGDSFFFDKKLKNSIFVHPNLVLFGLNRILNYNENS